MPATFTIPSAFTAIDKFSGPISRMGNAVNSFAFKSEAALSRVDRAFRTLMTPMTAFRQMLNSIGLYVGIYVFIRAIRGALDVMMDFEQANVNLASVMEKEDIPLLGKMGYQARLMAINYGLAASAVSELQYELTKMGFRGKEVLNMTESIVSGAIAMRAEPERMAELMGSQFKAFKVDVDTDQGSETARKMVAQLAYAANATAADFSSFATQLPILSNVAQLADVDYPKVLAMLGVLKDLQIHTASGATGLKNMFLDALFKQKMSVDEARAKVNSFAKDSQRLGYIFETNGRKTLLAAAGLSKMNDEYEELLKNINAIDIEYTERLAQFQLSTSLGALKVLKAAWGEFILAIDNGDGPVSKAIERYSKVASVMLLISSDSDVAKEALKKFDQTTINAANSALNWLNVIGDLILLLITFKFLLFASRIALFLYNVQLGVSTAFLIGNVMALRGNMVALYAYRIAAMAATAQQWIFNAAMAANPIGLIIIGIAALVGLVYTLAKHWESWGAAVALAFGPLGLLLNHVMSFINKWEGIKKSFSDGSFLQGIKSIGLALYDAILYPMMQLLEIIGKVTGFDWATNAAARLQAHRENMGIEKLDMAGERSVSEKNTTTKNNVRVDINAPLGYNVFGSDPNVNIKPVLSSTHGWHAPML